MTASVPVEYSLFLAAILFLIGLVGVLSRRNVMFILLSIEVMFNAAGLAFIAAGAGLAQADGQVMFMFVLAVTAAEVAVGLALLLRLYRHFGALDIDAASKMRG